MNVFENSSNTSEKNDEIDLLKLFSILIDARWFICLLTAFFSFIGFFYAFSSAPMYRSDALIQIEMKTSPIEIGMFGLAGESMLSDGTEAEIEILKSRMVLKKTVDKFNLSIQVMPNYFPLLEQRLRNLLDSTISLNISHFDIPANVESQRYTLTVISSPSADFIVEDEQKNKILQGKVGTLIEKDGYQIFVDNLNAQEGNSFTLWKRSYIDSIGWLSRNFKVNQRGKSGIFELFFDGEDVIKNQALLTDILDNFVAQNIKKNSATAEKSLVFLNESLPEVKRNLTKAEDALKQYRQNNESVDLSLDAKVKLSEIVKIQDQLKELTFKEIEIAQRFTKEHPIYSALLNNRDVLVNSQNKLQIKINELPAIQREILRLTRELDVNQQIYILLLNKVQELKILKASTIGQIRVLDEPLSSSKIIGSNKKLIVLLFTIAGGMLSIVLSLLMFSFTRGIKESKEIEELGITVIGCIPFSSLQSNITQNINKKLHFEQNERLLAESQPRDLAVEAFRNIRTNLKYTMSDSNNNVLMISSSNSGAGKSFFSINLAVVIANTGLKVLLVDADLRKGYIHDYFGVPCGDGLSELLSEKSSYKDTLKPSGVDNLSLVTRGTIPKNPAELLNCSNFSQFMNWASIRHDLVILDTPPILAVTDASIIGAYAGTTLLVGRYSSTKTKEVEAAYYRFAKAGIKVNAFVLNSVKRNIINGYDADYRYEYR